MDTTQTNHTRPVLSSSLRTLNRRNVSATCGSPASQPRPKGKPSLAAKENSSRYEQPPLINAHNSSLVNNLQLQYQQNDVETLNGSLATTCGINQDWRHGRSYRDTASEIISLYAHQSARLTGAPSLFEGSSRSKSFSTSSSRHTPSHKSFGTSSGHSDGGIQVSCSSAPLPPGWKRPSPRSRSPIVVYGEDPDYNRFNIHGPAQQRMVYGPPAFHQQLRRPPPLSLRNGHTRSNRYLHSKSPGPYMAKTVPGKSITPLHNTLPWTAKPTDRYNCSSTDQSMRSASLTSIVDMYQRPSTASSTYPPLKPQGAFYYDYSEEFDQPGNSNEGFNSELSTLKRNMSFISLQAMKDNERHEHIEGKDPHSDVSCESYLQGSHDDSIQEIEKVIANAIAKVSRGDETKNTGRCDPMLRPNLEHSQEASKHVASLSHLNSRPSAIHEDERARQAPESGESQPTPCEVESYPKPVSQVEQNSSVTSGKDKYNLDPNFEDFSSLLSSFDRLAMSPFAPTTEDDDADVQDQKQVTLDLLDCVALESRAYRRRHRRNVAALRISTMGFNADESTIDLPMSENNSLLCQEPHASSQESGSQSRLMKALPPLPKQSVEDNLDTALDDARQPQNKPVHDLDSVPNFGQMRSVKRTVEGAKNIRNPLKFKLRMNTSTSSVESECVPDGLKLTKHRERSLDEGQRAAMPLPSQPPRLKLKISRSQLGHGKPPQNKGITRNNRLKQCNSLADVIQPSRFNAMREALEDSTERQPFCRDCSLDTICSSSPRANTSQQLSDQFNISYPPSPNEVIRETRSKTPPRRKSLNELRKVESDIGPMNQNRLQQKISLLRLRITGLHGPTSPKSAQSVPVTRPDQGQGVVAMSEGANTALEEYDSNSEALSKSVKSDRVGGRVKRWATHAKLAVRSYVRRALVRPKYRKEDMEQL